MADTITTFINRSDLTYDALKAGITVLSNSSSETAVIKDVSFSVQKERTLILTDGVTELVKVRSSAKLTGTELVGKSSDVKLYTKAAAIFNQYTYYTYNATNLVATTVTLDTVFDDVVKSSNSFLFESVTGPLPTVTPNFNCVDKNNNYYYAALQPNASQQGQIESAKGIKNKLYRREGGVNGTQSTALQLAAHDDGPLTQKFCWDGKRYIHVATSSLKLSYVDNSIAVTSYDTTTGTSTVFEFTPSPYNSILGASVSAIEDFVFVYTPVNSLVYVINFKTQKLIGSFAAPGNLDNNTNKYDASFIAALKDSSGMYYALLAGPTTAFTPKLINLGTTISETLRVYSTEQYMKSDGYDISQYAYGYNGFIFHTPFVKNAQGDRYVFLGTKSQDQITSQIGIYDIETKNFTQLNKTTLPAFDGTITVKDANASVAKNDFGTVGIRVTGIKTT
jgi:hypothetical protein